VLLGEPPETLHGEFAENQPIPVPPDVVEVGLPAELLRQRPDIRSAERALASQTARIGVAKAELYPQFFLPGTLSLEALDIGNLNGSSLTYAFGPTMRWTLFAGGRIRSEIKIEEARTEQFLNAYEQTILLALEDTEGAMVAFAQERDRKISLEAAQGAAAQSVSLVKDLYRSGLTQFQNVLDMERSLAQRDDDLAVSRGLVAGNAVRIYRALGGGWDPEDPEPWLALETASTE
jgi:outer membrane protein TolC